MQLCLYNSIYHKTQLNIKQEHLLNVNAPAFRFENSKHLNQCKWNIFAKVFVPKNHINGDKANFLYTDNLGKVLTMNDNIKYSRSSRFKSYSSNMKVNNDTKALSKSNTNKVYPVQIITPKSTFALNKHEIHTCAVAYQSRK